MASEGAGNEHIRAASDAIWEQYLSLTRDFDPEQFLNVVQPVCTQLQEEPSVAAAFVLGLSTTFGARIAETSDPFDVARLQAACAVALLPMSISSADCADTILLLSKRAAESIGEGVDQLLAELSENKYALLSKDGGIADFYFLPLRVMSVLGWLGAAVHIQTISGEGPAPIAPKAAKLARLIVTHYVNSIIPVSDEMAPFFVSFVAAADALDFREELEAISGLLIRGLHDRGGRIADPRLGGEDAFGYLRAVTEGSYDEDREILANPTTLLPAVILAMDRCGLSDIADGAMRGFDHVNVNIFVPEDWTTFGAAVIEDGTNFSLNIGHTIFSVGDLVEEWAKIETGLAADPTLTATATRIASILASLLRPDRIAWFLMAGQQAAGTTTVEAQVEA